MTVDHNLHNSRQSPPVHYFSRRSISRLLFLIQRNADKLAERLSTAHYQGAVIQLDAAFSAATTDIISEYAYGISLGYLDVEDFQNDVKESVLATMPLCHVMKFFPLLLPVAEVIPEQILQKLSPLTANIFPLRKIVCEQTQIAFQNGGHVQGRESRRKNTLSITG